MNDRFTRAGIESGTLGILPRYRLENNATVTNPFFF